MNTTDSRAAKELLKKLLSGHGEKQLILHGTLRSRGLLLHRFSEIRNFPPNIELWVIARYINEAGTPEFVAPDRYVTRIGNEADEDGEIVMRHTVTGFSYADLANIRELVRVKA